MTTIITRTARHYRPYGFNGRYVASISLYKDGQVVFSSRQGWLEDATPASYGERDVEALVLSHEPRRATKLNLAKGGHFFMTSKKDMIGEAGYDLYIDVASGDLTVGEVFEQRQYTNETGETWCKALKITLRTRDGGEKTITTLVGGFYRKDNIFGEKMAELHEALGAKGLERQVSGLAEIAKDPALLAMLNAAAAAYALSQQDTAA